MTTKEALELAIVTLQNEPSTKKNREAVKLLRNLQRRDIVARWTKESIIEALDGWMDKNGKPPTTTNLAEPGMPGSNIIQAHFGVRASSFLRSRYPSESPKAPPKNKYGFQTADDWLDCFRNQFLKHCGEDGFNSSTYDMLKDKDTPLWLTIARHCGTTQWKKLMELAGVKYPGKIENRKPGTLRLSVKSPWLERFEAAVAKREELDRILIASLNK